MSYPSNLGLDRPTVKFHSFDDHFSGVKAVAQETQDQIARLFTLGKHAGHNVLALSPKRHITMRVMLCNPTDIFKVRRIDQFTVSIDPKECV
jgi:hypothetical protein